MRATPPPRSSPTPSTAPLTPPSGETFSLDGYYSVIGKADFGLYFFNSVTVTIVSLALVLIFGAMCAWALTEYRFRFNPLIALYMAIGIMVPAAPGYIGTMNLACVAGLALFSVGRDLSVPFSWFYWAGQWIPVSAVGLYYLRREGLSLRSLERAQENPA